MDSAPLPSATSPRFLLTWQPASRLPCLRLRTCRATSHDRFVVGGSGALDSTHFFRLSPASRTARRRNVQSSSEFFSQQLPPIEICCRRGHVRHLRTLKQ